MLLPFVEGSEQEYELLSSGYNYSEVAERLAVPESGVRERNKRIYHVDLACSFAKRVANDGVPCRLRVGDHFGYWFSGFFDGEGSLIIQRERHRSHLQRALKIQILLRNDDASVNQRIRKDLACGHVVCHPTMVKRASHPRSTRPRAVRGEKPACMFRTQDIRGLCEIIVPLFERYPLHSKKAREFDIWKQVVLLRYRETAGGSLNSKYSGEYCRLFDAAMQEIASIRGCHGSAACCSDCPSRLRRKGTNATFLPQRPESAGGAEPTSETCTG